MSRLIWSLFFGVFFITQNIGFAQGVTDQLKKDKKEVLIFYKTEGYWHKSIPAGRSFISGLGEDHGFKVTATKDAGDFNEKNLAKFELVIFLSTTGNVLDEKEQVAFKTYIKNGGN